MTTTIEGYTRAASLSDIAPGQLLGVEVQGERVCLARLGDDVFALEDRCTHALFPLSRGELLPDGRVECAWHGAQFDCRTGAPCNHRSNIPAVTYDVLLRDGDVHVRIRR